MAWGALVYGYAINVNDITQMPRVSSYKGRDGRTVLIDNEDVHPVEWAAEHYKYGEYVHVEDPSLWYSDRVVIGYFVGESGDELNLEDMDEAKRFAPEISEAVKFFTDWDTNINDYGYHIITIYD